MRFFRKKAIHGIPVDEIKNEPLYMSELFASIASRSEITSLYKKLCRQAHPDRFVGDKEKQAIANAIFKDIQKNQTSYDALKKLETRVNKELLSL